MCVATKIIIIYIWLLKIEEKFNGIEAHHFELQQIVDIVRQKEQKKANLKKMRVEN